MKRKFLVIASVLLLCSTPIFADAETDLNFYITPYDNYAVKESGASGNVRQTFGFGLEGQWGFIFGSPSDFFDMGLNFSFGADMLSGYAYDITDGVNHIAADTGALGVNFHATVGPLFRINIGDMNSIWISPGLKLGLGIGAATDDDVDISVWFPFNFCIALDVGYRLWVTDGFGISVGADLSWDMFGIFDLYPLQPGGFAVNVYLGVCFQ